MKRLLATTAIALSVAALAAAAAVAQAPPAQAKAAAAITSSAARPGPGAAGQTVLQGEERTRALAAASAALNRMTAIRARFMQVAPDGSVTQGQLTMQRPGRLRFAYDPPSPLTIVSDGATVAVHDAALRDTTRIPLRSTPLYYVLKRDVNFERDARITRVAREGEFLLITARDRSGEADGEITITFAGDELRQWQVSDGRRQTTTVMLSQLTPAGRIDPATFRAPETADPTARRKTR